MRTKGDKGVPTQKAQLRWYRLDAPVDEVRQHLLEKEYEEVPCARGDFLLFVKASEREPGWVEFLNQISVKPLNLASVEASFVLIRTAGDEAFVATGGTGHSAVQSHVEPDFGLDVVSRLVPVDRVKLRRNKSLTGRVEQEESVYRGYHNSNADPGNWAKLTKQIVGEVRNETLAEAFGLSLEGRKPVRLESSAGFTIKRALTIDETVQVIERVTSVLQREPIMPLMRGCQEVPRVEAAALEQELRKIVRAEYEAFLEEPESYESRALSLSYEDARQVVLSSRFNLLLGRTSVRLESLDIPAIFSEFHRQSWNPQDLHRIDSVRVEAFDDDGRTLFRDALRKLLVVELQHQESLYVSVDRRWFQVSTSFIERVEQRLVPFLSSETSYSLPAWPEDGGRPMREDRYLEEVGAAHNEGIWVLHPERVPVTGARDRVEVCDIMDTRHAAPRLVFVKRGIAGQARELARQAVDSTELLLEDAGFREKALELLRCQCGCLPNEEPSRWGVVIAVRDHVAGRSGREPLLRRMSTVAKMELADALESLFRRGFNPVIITEVRSAEALHGLETQVEEEGAA